MLFWDRDTCCFFIIPKIDDLPAMARITYIFSGALSAALLILVPFSGKAQNPFTCENQFFVTLSSTPPSLNEVVIDPQTGSAVFESINGNTVIAVNSAGYRSTDNYIYCIDPDNLRLVRLNSLGVAQVLTTLPLTPLVSYFAGDITPDGRYLVLIGTRFFTNGSANAAEIVRIDLDTPGYPVTTVNINVNAQIFDIAFHPVTDVLYGYDSFQQRLAVIDPFTGSVTFPVPPTNVPVLSGSLFFDAYGNLFAYGSPTPFQEQNTLYRIDPATGASTFLTRGENAPSSDGCSCPYTIELSKSVLPEISAPCSEVEYTFTMVNASRNQHTGLKLEDALPPGFTFVKISENPVGGTLLSPPGSSFFALDNITLPRGTFEVKIIVNTGNASAGIHRNQAVLRNLPSSLGGSRLSDDLSTLISHDSTELLIKTFPFDTIKIEKGLCEGAPPLLLDVGQYAAGLGSEVTYLWNDGSTASSIEVNLPGNYQTIMALGCDTAVVQYTIDYSSIVVNMEEDDFSIALGDSVLLQAIVVNSHLQTLVSWIDPEPGSIRCPTCEETVARPFNDLRYTILVQNEKGCQDSAFVQVRVKKNTSLYFPNVFTPDSGDQVNSYFYGFGDRYGTVQVLAVYSRWGELMFEAKGITLNDALAGWDGTWNGKTAPPGVYVWTATVVFLDGQELKLAGDVTLIR